MRRKVSILSLISSPPTSCPRQGVSAGRRCLDSDPVALRAVAAPHGAWRIALAAGRAKPADALAADLLVEAHGGAPVRTPASRELMVVRTADVAGHPIIPSFYPQQCRPGIAPDTVSPAPSGQVADAGNQDVHNLVASLPLRLYATASLRTVPVTLVRRNGKHPGKCPLLQGTGPELCLRQNPTRIDPGQAPPNRMPPAPNQRTYPNIHEKQPENSKNTLTPQ